MANEMTRAPSGALAQGRPETPQEMLHRIAHEEKIPPSGITILGGRPYINVTGLDSKLRTKCDDEKLEHVGTEYIPIQTATKENGNRAGGYGVVKLFDRSGFQKALDAIAKAGPVTKEVLDSLREMYFRVFKMRGFASPETLKMGIMQTPDNIEHMAERRATNRAKREATGTGLTSLDEMAEAEASTSPAPAAPAPATTTTTATAAAPVTAARSDASEGGSRRVYVKAIRPGNPKAKKPHIIRLMNDSGAEADSSTFEDSILDVAKSLLDQDAPGIAEIKKVQKGDRTYINLVKLDPGWENESEAGGTGVIDAEGVEYDPPSEGDGREE